jgi:hypothetical protein
MCDCLVALPGSTAHGGTLFAKNADRDATEAIGVRRAPPRRDRSPLRCTYIEIDAHPTDTLDSLLVAPDWMWGAEMGINEAGVVIGNERIFTTLDPRTAPDALTGMDLLRLGLERGPSASAAVTVISDLLERYGQGGSGHASLVQPYWSSFLIADPSTAFVVETSGATWEAAEVHGTAAISNRTTIPSFDAAHRHPRQRVAEQVDPRLHASRSLLARTPVGEDSVRAHLADHSNGGWSICMHADDAHPPQATTASMIVALPAPGQASTATPHAKWHGATIDVAIGSPCSTSYRRIDPTAV